MNVGRDKYLLIILIIGFGLVSVRAQWYNLLTLDVSSSDLSHYLFVGPAGDLNGDQYDDFFVGNPNYNSGQGFLKIIYGSENPDTVADWFAQVPNAHPSYFGAWADNIGDMDMDGQDEIVVGAPLYDYYFGRVFLFRTEPFDTLYDEIFLGAHEGFGEYRAYGDINFDGYRDLLIGENATPPLSQAASVYLFLGQSEIDTDPDWTLTRHEDGDVSGISMDPSCSGDFNGDGYDDFLVRENVDYIQDSLTSVFNLYFGEIIPDTIPAFTFADGVTQWVGDLNGDSMADLLKTKYTDNSIRAILYFGNDAGDTLHSQLLYDSIFEPNDIRFSVRSIGDLNSDSYDDLLILRGPVQEHQYTYTAELLYGGIVIDTISDLNFNIPRLNNKGIIDLGDINGDGRREVAAQQYFSYDSVVTSIFACNPTKIDTGASEGTSFSKDISVFPNPFNSYCTIMFPRDYDKNVSINIFNIAGQLVRVIKPSDDNRNIVVWDGKGSNDQSLSAGIYFLNVNGSKGIKQTGRIALLK